MQFVKFALVGAMGTLLHYAVLIFLVSGLGSDPSLGAMAGATCGAVFNYWLNHRFTFRSDRPHAEALPRFLLLAAIGIALNGIIVKVLTMAGINYLIGQVCATLAVLVINFVSSKLWIFRQSR